MIVKITYFAESLNESVSMMHLIADFPHRDLASCAGILVNAGFTVGEKRVMPGAILSIEEVK